MVVPWLQLYLVSTVVPAKQLVRMSGFLDWVLGDWAHCTVPVCLDSFVFMFVFLCVYLVILHMCCIIVTRWGGPGGIEA